MELTQSTGAVLHVSLVERLRLIELLSVLSSILVSVHVLLSRPARRVPQSRVHGVS